MKAKPILFSAPMIRALLAGTKTQTRRVVQRHPSGHHWASLPHRADYSCGYRNLHSDVWQFEHRIALNPQPDRDRWIRCPYGAPGDLLWVRESFQPLFAECWDEGRNPDGSGDRVNYKTGEGYSPNYVADGGAAEFMNLDDELSDRVWPSIHMPRWASRLTLRITDVRVQRLQDISDEDAKAEGVTLAPSVNEQASRTPHRVGFYRLWESINGPGAWDANNWVWALTFDVFQANVDQVRARFMDDIPGHVLASAGF